MNAAVSNALDMPRAEQLWFHGESEITDALSADYTKVLAGNDAFGQFGDIVTALRVSLGHEMTKLAEQYDIELTSNPPDLATLLLAEWLRA